MKRKAKDRFEEWNVNKKIKDNMPRSTKKRVDLPKLKIEDLIKEIIQGEDDYHIKNAIITLLDLDQKLDLDLLNTLAKKEKNSTFFNHLVNTIPKVLEAKEVDDIYEKLKRFLEAEQQYEKVNKKYQEAEKNHENLEALIEEANKASKEKTNAYEKIFAEKIELLKKFEIIGFSMLTIEDLKSKIKNLKNKKDTSDKIARESLIKLKNYSKDEIVKEINSHLREKKIPRLIDYLIFIPIKFLKELFQKTGNKLSSLNRSQKSPETSITELTYFEKESSQEQWWSYTTFPHCSNRVNDTSKESLPKIRQRKKL